MNTLQAASKTKVQFFAHILILSGFIMIGASIGLLFSQFLQKTCCKEIGTKNFHLILHGTTASGGFIVGPLCYWQYIEKKSLRYFFSKDRQQASLWIPIALLTISVMVVNVAFSYWNMQLKFPSFLKSFEGWAQQQRIDLKNQLAILTHFKSVYDLFLTLLVLGMIAAIGEEILCRGILQYLLKQTFHKEILNIFVTAFLFSAMHIDPYLFLPRFLMGILLGYLYSWTKNLFFPIFAHFLNNSIALLIEFLEQRKIISAIPTSTLPPWSILIACGLISFRIILYIKNKAKVQKEILNDERT